MIRFNSKFLFSAIFLLLSANCWAPVQKTEGETVAEAEARVAAQREIIEQERAKRLAAEEAARAEAANKPGCCFLRTISGKREFVLKGYAKNKDECASLALGSGMRFDGFVEYDPNVKDVTNCQELCSKTGTFKPLPRE